VCCWRLPFFKRVRAARLTQARRKAIARKAAKASVIARQQKKISPLKYTITAHPTTYGGVNFRSRLEARWAAFFDLLEWKWEYEPVDLYGWVPDFRLGPLPPTKLHPGEYYGIKYLRDPRPFVEVKPVELPDTGDCTPGLSEAFKTDKIERAVGDDDHSVLLLGNSYEHVWRIPDTDWADGAIHLGYLRNQRLWREAGNMVQWRPR
jgi:hypothetical protein